MLREETFFGEEDKVEIAIQRLKSFEPPDGYYLAFSGGKDSQCIYHLAKMANVKFDAHYTVTSVDPPELVRFIKDNYPDVVLDLPRNSQGKVITMWNLIVEKKSLPTRHYRYCCGELKEPNGKGRLVITGVRWAESPRRKEQHGVIDTHIKSKPNDKFKTTKRGDVILNDDNSENRRLVEQCYRTGKFIINPIVDWEDEDVWEFLNKVAKVPHCCLYDQGYARIGCIGCPMSTQERRRKDFERYPKYKQAYIKTIGKMLEARGRGIPTHDCECCTDPVLVFKDWCIDKHEDKEDDLIYD